MGDMSSGSKSAGYEVRNHHRRVFRMGTPILSTHSEYSLSDFHDERPDRHHMPDDCRASWSDGVRRPLINGILI